MRSCGAVWPDAGIKSNPYFPKAALKVSKVVFYLKMIFLKVAQKFEKYVGYLKETICCQNLQVSPNLITLMRRDILMRETISVTRCWNNE